MKYASLRPENIPQSMVSPQLFFFLSKPFKKLKGRNLAEFSTLLGTNISPPKGTLEDYFLFPKGECVIVPCMVLLPSG